MTANPVTVVLPVLLIVTWTALWLRRRPAWPWFFLAAAVLAVGCFPAGVLARRAEMDGTGCTPDNLCISMTEIPWWVTGTLGFLTTCALAILTPIVDLVLSPVRGGPVDPAAEQRP